MFSCNRCRSTNLQVSRIHLNKNNLSISLPPEPLSILQKSKKQYRSPDFKLSFDIFVFILILGMGVPHCSNGLFIKVTGIGEVISFQEDALKHNCNWILTKFKICPELKFNFYKPYQKINPRCPFYSKKL